MFHVGQKVVCVRDFDSPKLDGEIYPERGRIYTVRAIDLCNGKDCLRVHEIRNPIYYPREQADGEATFVVKNFRPVTERKTDISVFTAMLTGAPNDVERVE